MPWTLKYPSISMGSTCLGWMVGAILWLGMASQVVAAQEWMSELQQLGFHSLFDGKSLDGWRGATESYEVQDGCIVCKPGKGGVLYHREELTDFELMIDFQLPPGGNNGLAIRYPGAGHAATEGMCELQILDDEAEQYRNLDSRQYHGSIYGIIPAKRGALKPAGEWNHQRVTVKGHEVRVELNGQEIVNADIEHVTDFKDGTPHPGKDRRSGFLGFAGHNDPVRFRNIWIRRLDPYRLSHFSVDATIPLQHRCMGILPQKSVRVLDPLWVHGFILQGPQLPLAIVTVDWCEIRNRSYDRWRDRIAEAIGTTRERVVLSCLHQHDAPVIDEEAQELLDQQGLVKELFDPDFHRSVLDEVAMAARVSLDKAVGVTHVGFGSAAVEQIASSRRMEEEGKIHFQRGSSSGREARFREAPEGEIDPVLRTLSFWNEEQCLLEFHTYATHPMSYYGKGEVSSDFVGLARSWRQREMPGVKQVYASGCSGDVTAGKYNDGTLDSRMGLAQRLRDAMARSHDATERWPCTLIQVQSLPLELEYASQTELQPVELRRRLQDVGLPVEQRILAAMGLASWGRVNQPRPIDMACVDFGKAKLLLFPGETFVGYQLRAQHLSDSGPVLCVGYGESWTGYVPTEAAFREKFHENWQWVGRDSPNKLERLMSRLLRKE